MKIKFKNFTLQPGLYAKDRWDLIRTKNIVMANLPNMKSKYPNAKVGDTVGTQEEDMGYDMTLDTAVSKAISYLLAENEDVVDLKGYLSAYKREKEELVKLLEA